MNANQQQFLDFILARVKEGLAAEAAALLKTNFEKQDAGTFNLQDALGFVPKMTPMVKPEHLDEVTKLLKQFAANWGK